MLFEQDSKKDLLRLVTAGSVDDGKSTLIGQLLFGSKGIYEDQLEAVKKVSQQGGGNSGTVDLALLTDGLKAEREQGITIDVAYRFFTTPKRKFIIADCPGHEQYTRNMVTGASTADLAVILIDATQGVFTQTKRHTFIASLLGIPHLVVAVNKMDLVDYQQSVFETIRADYTEFSAKLEVSDLTFIPMSALRGDNVVSPGTNMPWYQGRSLLDYLETVHIASDRNLIDLRFPVQYVLRHEGSRRGYLGSVTSGIIKVGDAVTVIPSGQRTQVISVFGPDGELQEAFPPMSVGVTVKDELDISRGNMLVHRHNVPRVDKLLDAMIVWMHEDPLVPEREYLVKHGTTTIPGHVSDIRYRIDVNTLHRSSQSQLSLNEIGRCLVNLSRPIAYDAYQRNRFTGSFIVIDRVHNNTVGAGIILDREPSDLRVDLHTATAEPKSKHLARHASLVSNNERVQRMGGEPCTLWFTGLAGSGKTTLAYALERRIFDLGRAVFVLDGENVRLGFNRDLGFTDTDRRENIRRAAECARMLNEAGLIAICSFLSPAAQDRALARDIIGAERFLEIYLSAPLETCRTRDAHQLYQRAENGDIKNLPGVSAVYEIPDSPALVVPTHTWSVESCVDAILATIQEKESGA